LQVLDDRVRDHVAFGISSGRRERPTLKANA
jgi:hypothetical protein